MNLTNLKNRLSKICNFNLNSIKNIYLYGSVVYGTTEKNSDIDLIIVIDSKTNYFQFSDNLVDITFFNINTFKEKIDNHEISVLECLFLSKELVLQEDYKFTFKLDLVKLRHSLSAKSFNSFVKAKKKLTIEKDFDLKIGQKSLFHSIRIIRFGIQIVKYNKIINYNECNTLYFEILQCYTWNEMFEKYKRLHNNTLTEFRKLAPKI